MARITTDSKHYAAIADTIRTLTKTQETYSPAEMPDGIQAVSDTGYENGRHTGYAEGHVAGFSAGESVEQARFWSEYQQNGARTDYNFAFAGAGWNSETFHPHYNLVVENGYEMFAYSTFAGSLKERLEECRVTMTFRGNGLFMNLFGLATKITELGVIDLSQLVNPGNTHIFNQCISLQTIEKLVVPTVQYNWSSWFTGCIALENITFEGTIVTGGMDLSDSPKLSRESILSLFSCLADKSGSSSPFKLILGATNLAKLTDSDKAIATGKGWTLT